MKTKDLSIIKYYESCVLFTYKCPSGIDTIGWGHTGKDVKPGMSITQLQADELLRNDLIERENQLNSLKLKLNQNQFDALISLIYNIGIGNFKKSTLYKMLQVNPNSANISTEFMKFVNDRTGKKLLGLVKRRNKEIELYFRK